MFSSRGEASMQVVTCEVCGKRVARYVCQECGRKICETCLEPHTWVCSDCYSRLKREAPPMLEAPSWSLPFKLFLVGFFLIFIGILFIMITAILSGAPTSVGGLIWIIPLPPIIFGVGPYPIWAIVLAVAITVLGIVLFFALRRRPR